MFLSLYSTTAVMQTSPFLHTNSKIQGYAGTDILNLDGDVQQFSAYIKL